ncbi:hypothetical protein JL107_14885 [Nakamurella flavida]|uniref:Uncharacterized protein n=1 Tax=Nakamurella flavida TaxID=363630 RepID=A0A939C3J8_9ACTN|nr:hypothetical protein [Nakamurella flavida]MBM9477735.1 hypothetical protein [Nakamurella flavida]MDP9779287.1 hypothetical protein [Nakamurella flavida]
MTDLEFWPDHGPGPLWIGGAPADLDALGLPAALVDRLRTWNAGYAEDRLPVDGPGDPHYLGTGVRLLHDVRAALTGRFRVGVTEPWWDGTVDA